MATGTKGIATEGEAKSKLGYSGSVDTNKCCTKARAVAMGADSSKLSAYKDNQLVKYSDIYSSIFEYYLDINVYNQNSTNKQFEVGVNLTESDPTWDKYSNYGTTLRVPLTSNDKNVFIWTHAADAEIDIMYQGDLYGESDDFNGWDNSRFTGIRWSDRDNYYGDVSIDRGAATINIHITKA